MVELELAELAIVVSAVDADGALGGAIGEALRRVEGPGEQAGWEPMAPVQVRSGKHPSSSRASTIRRA